MVTPLCWWTPKPYVRHMCATGTARFGKATPSPVCALLWSLAAASSRGVSLRWTVHRYETARLNVLYDYREKPNFSLSRTAEKNMLKRPQLLSVRVKSTQWNDKFKQVQAGFIPSCTQSVNLWLKKLKQSNQVFVHILKGYVLYWHWYKMCHITSTSVFMNWLSHRVVEGMVVELRV